MNNLKVNIGYHGFVSKCNHDLFADVLCVVTCLSHDLVVSEITVQSGLAINGSTDCGFSNIYTGSFLPSYNAHHSSSGISSP